MAVQTEVVEHKDSVVGWECMREVFILPFGKVLPCIEVF